jgi:diguanylate cyclase (GGDEF)-like protein
MQDLQSQQIQALSAHIEGLEAGLEALADEPETSASLRRIARSLCMAAGKAGAKDLAVAAHALQTADDDSVEPLTRECLRRFGELRSRVEPERIRVLLVEDSRTVAVAVQSYLEAAGHVVHHAADATSAERLLNEQPIDIVLLDLILPDRDGRDLLLQMREAQATADLPVVVLSAKEGAVPRAECMAVGAADFLQKPVDPSVLRAAVAKHARRRKSAGDSSDEGAQQVLGRAALVEAYEPLRLAVETDSQVAVALLAMNGFDAVVESLGAHGADRLMTEAAGPLAEGLEEGEMIGRWGRSEIVLLLPGSSAEDAKRKLRLGVARLAHAGLIEKALGADLDVSFSAGVAVPESSEDLREVVSAAETSLYKARASGRGGAVTAEEPAPERPRRVMLVEDDRVTATLINHRLVREGFEVAKFVNGEDAFEWAESSTFDLAILDVKVPGMDGFELLERLRAMERLDAVPIVMLTGLGGEADVIRGLELGANDYMLKPFSPTELLARVRRLAFGGTGGPPDAGGPSAPAENDAN